MEQLDERDVQGIVAGSYGKFDRSLYVLLNVTNAVSAGKWLNSLFDSITHCKSYDDAELEGLGQPAGPLVNIAFSSEGLRALGLHEDIIMQFSSEFVSGMAPLPEENQSVARRSGMLGDEGANAPTGWNWGGWHKNPKVVSTESGTYKDVHILLAMFGRNDAELSDYFDNLISFQSGEMSGITVCIGEIDREPLKFVTYLRSDHREHFGFKDGISQPSILGLGDTKKQKKAEKKKENLKSEPDEFVNAEEKSDLRLRQIHEIALGEILLGHENERGQKYRVPQLNTQDGSAKNPNFELGKNGTYFVVRQLKQDVVTFANILKEGAEKFRDHQEPGEGRQWIAARLLGRDYDGYPITQEGEIQVYPPQPTDFYDDETPDEGRNQQLGKPPNDFKFHEGDENGLACPLTAHIRRAFPRDTVGPDPHTALKLSKRHRILRRGRLFGEPVENTDKFGNYDLEKIEKPQPNRGLFFVALNADIAGHFETIQHSWINNRHFAGRYNEIDPVTGQSKSNSHDFAIQQRPFGFHLGSISDCVNVSGGGYFFLPGMNALKQIIKVAQNSS